MIERGREATRSFSFIQMFVLCAKQHFKFFLQKYIYYFTNYHCLMNNVGEYFSQNNSLELCFLKNRRFDVDKILYHAQLTVYSCPTCVVCLRTDIMKSYPPLVWVLHIFSRNILVGLRDVGNQYAIIT